MGGGHVRRSASRTGTAALGALRLVGVVAPPASADTGPPVPLTSGVGSEPRYASLLGASGGFAVLTREHPTNLSLPSRGGPVSAVDVSTGASHDLTFPPGSSPEVSEGHALLGDGSGGWAVEDLATGATSSLPPVNGTERGGESGLWRLEQPPGEPVQHLLVRDVVTGDSTDHGPLPSSLNPNMAVVRDAAGNLVVVDRYNHLFDVVTGTTWTEHALPVGLLDCPSLTTDALGCYTGDAVLRVPLDGSPPVTAATGSRPWAVAVTPGVTAWVLTDGTLRTQPAAGGTVTRATQDVSIV